jgi:hypothetical protein
LIKHTKLRLAKCDAEFSFQQASLEEIRKAKADGFGYYGGLVGYIGLQPSFQH